MANGFSRELRKALKEYYAYYGDRKPEPVRWIDTKKYGPMLLVHFTDTQEKDDRKMSGILHVVQYSDGRIDISEVDTDERCHEDEMIEDFLMEANCKEKCETCCRYECRGQYENVEDEEDDDCRD